MKKIGTASIVTAFGDNTIGTKVLNAYQFMQFLQKCVEKHDISKDRQIGQHFIPMPTEAFETVSAGAGRRTENPEDYVLRLYRGSVGAYLKREKAATVESLSVIVYTLEAYLADPDIKGEEAERITNSDATHVLVAILASAGPKSPLSPFRLVHNIAGGNKEALQWSADEIRGKALESKIYHDKWATVAD